MRTNRALPIVQPDTAASQTPAPPPRPPEGPSTQTLFTLSASSNGGNTMMGAVQQMVSVETPHSNGTRLGLAHSSSATQDQSLSFGSGHGEFGNPRQLILSEEPPPLPLQLSASPPQPRTHQHTLAHSALPPNQRTLRLCFQCLETDRPADESRSPLDRGWVAVVAIVLGGRFTGLNNCSAEAKICKCDRRSKKGYASCRRP